MQSHPLILALLLLGGVLALLLDQLRDGLQQEVGRGLVDAGLELDFFQQGAPALAAEHLQQQLLSHEGALEGRQEVAVGQQRLVQVRRGPDHSAEVVLLNKRHF